MRHIPHPSKSFLGRIALLLAIFAATGFLLAGSLWSQTRREQLFGNKTIYFSSDSAVAPLESYPRVFAVGHNAGYSTQTVDQARSGGARVIEIDVVLLGDELVSAHVPPMAVIGQYVFRGATLESAWDAAGEDAVIQLDLKDSTPRFRQAVVTFLREHAGERTVLVASPDVTTLQVIATETPDVLRFLSVSNASQLGRLLRDDELIDLIDGVTLRYQLATAETVGRLKDRDLVVLAWTVNDLAVVNELVALGVDGFSTNNLTIMGLLNTPEAEVALELGRP